MKKQRMTNWGARGMFEILRDAAMVVAQADAVLTAEEMLRITDHDVMWSEPDREHRTIVRLKDMEARLLRVARFERDTVLDLQRYRRYRDLFLFQNRLTDIWRSDGQALFSTSQGRAMAMPDYASAIKTLAKRKPALVRLTIEQGVPPSRVRHVMEFARWCFRGAGTMVHRPRQHVRPR